MVFIVLIVLSVLSVALLALYRISDLLLYARRQPLTRTPADCGLEYEEAAFLSADGLSLKGWWIPAPGTSLHQGQNPGVILLHPMLGNRHGVSPGPQHRPLPFHTDFDLLKTAQVFHQAGYSVLMFDFRSHGESQRGLCAGGLTEDQDVLGATDYVFGRMADQAPEGETPKVGLVGFGLGAAAAIAAIGREKGGAEPIRVFSGDSEGGVGWAEIQPANVKKLSFLVAVQPVSLGRLVRGRLRDLSIPLSPVLGLLVDRICQARGGYPLGAGLLLKFAGQVNVPVLYVQARPDPWQACGEVQSFYEAAPGPKQIWWIDKPLRRLEAFNYVGDHLEMVLEFAAQHMSQPADPGWLPAVR